MTILTDKWVRRQKREQRKIKRIERAEARFLVAVQEAQLAVLAAGMKPGRVIRLPAKEE